ncbi:MAG TPA: hypothetical protein VN829_10555 [Dongiaceae bacterium]|nr:hypothetical protein [Dongiaceae bacterium]
MINCWRYRRIISRSADEDVPLPPAAQAHVAQCGQCRRVYVTEHQIVRRLCVGAAAQKRQPPAPFLQARIMARIASSQPGARRAPKPSGVGWPLALATACIVLATVLLWPGRPGPKPKPSPGQIAQVQPPRAVETPSAIDWPETKLLTQWATNLDQPLRTEMQAVFHDAQGAVTALADNFLPQKLRQTLLSEPPSRN